MVPQAVTKTMKTMKMKMVKERTKLQSITEKNIIIHDIAKKLCSNGEDYKAGTTLSIPSPTSTPSLKSQ